MGKFNSVVKPTKVENLAGGVAFQQSTKGQIAAILVTSLLQDKYYENEKQLLSRLKEKFNELKDEDKIFLAKASIYARNIGMRSISHVSAGLISKLSNKDWLDKYFNNIIYRVDDMNEIISYIFNEQDRDKKKHKLPSALKRGFAKAFNKFDGYQLAKYKNEKNEVSLVDVINLVHPIPSTKNSEALQKLIKSGEKLKQTETWNAKMIEATKDIKAETKEEKEKLKAEAKKNVWEDFVNKGEKIEYFALLKNLRNIAADGTPEVLEKAHELLTNAELIKKSKVLPFRFLTAYKQITDRENQIAIQKALDICLNNVPKFEGKTLIALDTSGSMTDTIGNKLKISELGAMFAAALYKTSNCDLITFANYAQYKKLNPLDPIMSIIEKIGFACGGTNVAAIFAAIGEKKYDRIILISDMQSWGHSNFFGEDCRAPFKKYRKISPDCKLYSFDLSGYGTVLFPEKSVYCMAGISDKVFDIMKKFEEDPNAFINEIEAIQI